MKPNQSFITALCLLLIGLPASAPLQETLINYSLDLSSSGTKSAELTAVVEKVAVPRLLLDIAAQPRAPDYLDAALRDAGVANRKLVEAGLFADPYAESRRFKGYIPAVYASLD
jgi:hypothetical protein